MIRELLNRPDNIQKIYYSLFNNRHDADKRRSLKQKRSSKLLDEEFAAKPESGISRQILPAVCREQKRSAGALVRIKKGNSFRIAFLQQQQMLLSVSLFYYK